MKYFNQLSCIFATFQAILVLGFALNHKRINCNFRNGEQGRIFTLKESMWFALTSLTPQGGGEGPKAISGKVTFIFCQLGYGVLTKNR